MTQLFFLRHGETDWNRMGRLQGIQDIPLNDEGRHQAQALARSWKEPLDVVLTSPLSRARDTARIWCEHLGFGEPEQDALLVERDFGVASGLTLAERNERFPDGRYPGGESLDDLLGRARRFLDDVHARHPGRRLGVVSHGGFIGGVLSWVTNFELGYGKTLLPNVCVTRLDRTDAGWSVVYAGRTLAESRAEPPVL